MAIFGNTKKSAPAEKPDASKELHKLRRVDLIALLLDQTRENEKAASDIANLTELTERLKNRLDEKDAQIEHLKKKLDDKDAQIEHLKGRLDDKDARIKKLEEAITS